MGYGYDLIENKITRAVLYPCRALFESPKVGALKNTFYQSLHTSSKGSFWRMKKNLTASICFTICKVYLHLDTHKSVVFHHGCLICVLLLMAMIKGLVHFKAPPLNSKLKFISQKRETWKNTLLFRTRCSLYRQLDLKRTILKIFCLDSVWRSAMETFTTSTIHTSNSFVFSLCQQMSIIVANWSNSIISGY